MCQNEWTSLSAVYSYRIGGAGCGQPFFLLSDSHCLIQKMSLSNEELGLLSETSPVNNPSFQGPSLWF